MVMHLRIVGTDLPGARCEPAPNEKGTYEPIYVGVQRGREVVSLVRGDEREAVFEFDVDIRRGRFAGPYVHGRDGQRFVYLSWGEVVDGEFTMFRRAKLHLDQLDPSETDGRVVHGTLKLSDDRRQPLCASVRPPRISWAIQ